MVSHFLLLYYYLLVLHIYRKAASDIKDGSQDPIFTQIQRSYWRKSTFLSAETMAEK